LSETETKTEENIEAAEKIKEETVSKTKRKKKHLKN